MVEQIKLIYKPKGFEYFSNNESEKKCTFNFSLSFKKILSNYYVDIILIYFTV